MKEINVKMHHNIIVIQCLRSVDEATSVLLTGPLVRGWTLNPFTFEPGVAWDGLSQPGTDRP